jgi:arsenate reductase-like glutaredoxin family protein
MKRKAKVVERPQSPPKKPHCATCHLTLAYLEQRKETYECSRIECPQRKRLTAA